MSTWSNKASSSGHQIDLSKVEDRPLRQRGSSSAVTTRKSTSLPRTPTKSPRKRRIHFSTSIFDNQIRSVIMPPRLALQNLRFLQKSNDILPPTFLLPFLTQSTRNASILAELSDTPGAYSHRIRRGRGPSSGKGKTSGRGHKGQKQHGKVPAHFNGGQTPDHIASGHHGFKNMYVMSEG